MALLGWTAAIASAALAAPPPDASPRPAPKPVARSAAPTLAAEWDTPNAPYQVRRPVQPSQPPAALPRPTLPAFVPPAPQDDAEDGVKLPTPLRPQPLGSLNAASLPAPPPPAPLRPLPGLDLETAPKPPSPGSAGLMPLPAFPKTAPALPKAIPGPDSAEPASAKKASVPMPLPEPDPDPEPLPEPADAKSAPLPKQKGLAPLPAPTGPTRPLPPLGKKAEDPPAKPPEAKDPPKTEPKAEPKQNGGSDLKPIPNEKDPPKTPADAGKKTPDEKTPETPKKAEPLPDPKPPTPPAIVADATPNVNVRAWDLPPQRLRALWPDDDLHEWTTGFRALLLFRSQSDRRGLTNYAGGSVTGGDFDNGAEWGGEVSLQRRYDAVNSLEIRGMAADRLHRRYQLGETGVANATIPAIGPSAAAFALVAPPRYEFSNRYLDAGMEWSQRYGTDLPTPWRVRTLVGPRIVNMSESFALNTTGGAGAPVAFGSRTQNALFGATAGAVASYLPANRPISFELAGRVGAFGNVAHATQDFTGPGFARNDRDGVTKFSTLAQLDATIDWRLAEGFHLFTGYRFQGYRGMLRTLEQPTFDTTLATPFGARGDGQFLVHSLMAGFRLHWGGATDPDTRASGMRPYLIEGR